MDIFYILVLGGLIAAGWLRITQLERRIAAFAAELEALRLALPDPAPRTAEPDAAPQKAATAPRPAVPVQPRAKVATEASESVAEDVLAAAPELAPAPAPAAVIASEPLPEPEQSPSGFTFDLEDIFGRRLPIWGGGFALAIAGIFLVRFSIEAGLLTPPVRVALSFVFGLALLGGAEAAYRFADRLADPRVRQALAGAGLATLYGAFYLAGTTYGLIGAGAAFIGLAAVTAAAIALSFRFGLPSAVIGLIGGFAAPLLVDSDSANVPLLSFYLALITGGLAWSGQAQGRSWLSYAALAAGLGWGVLMMVLGVSSSADFVALGAYLVVLGTVLPAFLHAKGEPGLPHLIAGALATLQMAVLVTDAGFAPLTWGLYLLIGAALAGLGWRFDALRLGTLVAAGLGLWLLVIWPEPDPQFFALVAAAQVVIFAGVPLACHWLGRAKLLDLAQLGAVSLIMGIAVYTRYGRWGGIDTEPVLAASLAALALPPLAAFVLLWQRDQQAETRKALVLLAPAALLAFAALLLLTPAWAAPLMALMVTGPLLWCHARRDALALHNAAWAGAAVTAAALMVTPGFVQELTQLGDLSEPGDMLRAVVRWAATTAPFAAMAFVSRQTPSRHVAEAFAVALAYGVIAQVVPSAPLAWIAAAGAIALTRSAPGRLAAWASALAIAAAWTLVPLAGWVTGGMLALVGEPFLLADAIAPVDLGLRIAPFAAVLGVLAWKAGAEPAGLRMAALIGLGLTGGIGLHSLYKQVFGITSLLRFEHYGMGERTIWQTALVLAAFAAHRRLPEALRRPVSLGLIAAALAHFAWFTLALHNPLMSVQHVGPTPIANWLTLAYLTAIAGLWLGGKVWGGGPAVIGHAIDPVTMALISLGAVSLLRQIFAGSVLTARAIGQTESLLLSLLGILLALGFLWWGSWRASRSWRIGSLVLMLGAVIKVFLIDAAGLEGLLRIASFMALGFSLIGIGWVFSRQLSQRHSGAAS